MPTKTPDSSDRKPRADAQRNRERILGVAKAGVHPVRREREPGVDREESRGRSGNLVPTLSNAREELLVAVYRSETEKLAAAGRTLADSMPPVEALRAWLLVFVDAVETS